jgi:hypothetical protein
MRRTVVVVKPKPGEIRFDAEYFVRFQVLEVVYGTYAEKESLRKGR